MKAGVMSWVRYVSVSVVVATLAASAGVAQEQSADAIEALNAEAGELYKAGKYAEAVPIAQRAVALAERQLGPDHPKLAQPLETLGGLHYKRGRYAEGERLYRRSLDIRERALGLDHAEVGATLNGLAVLLYAQGRFYDAEPLFKRALSVREKSLGPDHPDVGATLNGFAVLLHALGRFDDAEPFLKRALSIQEKGLGPDHLDVGTSLNNLAVLYFTQGRHAEAEPLHKRSLTIREKVSGQEHASVGESLNNLAMLYESQGRYADAEPLLLRSLAIRQKATGPIHEGMVFSPDLHELAVTLNNLAGLYHTQGRYAEADQIFKTVASLFELVSGPNHPRVGTALNNVAVVYRSQGRYADAEPFFQRALSVWETALGPDHTLVAVALDNLAQLYQAQGRYSEAEPLYQRGLAVREKAFTTDHPEVGRSLDSLAGLAFAQRDWTRAAEFWRRSTALVVRRTQRGTPGSHPTQAPTGKAKSEVERSSQQFLSLVKVLYRSVPYEGGAHAMHLRETFQAAQWATASEAAQALAKMAARAAKGDAAIAGLVRERQDLVDEWQKRDAAQNVAVAQVPEQRDGAAEAANVTRLADIDLRIADIDRRLTADFPDYASFASPTPLAVEEVQALLDESEALLLFLDTPQLQPINAEVFVWVITKTGVRWARSDLGRTALTDEVAALRCGLDATVWWGGEARDRCVALLQGAHPRQDVIDGQLVDVLPFDLQRAHALYKALFGSVEEFIKDKHLLIVPSGPLTSLPLHVLVAQPPKTRIPLTLAEYRKAAWLATHQPITMLPSVSSLKALRQFAKTSRASRTYLGIGNPLLDGQQDDPQWGQHYRNQAETARAKQQCPRAWTQRIALATARPLTSFAKVFRGAQADVDEVRAWTPLPETADELCEVGRRLGVPESEILLGNRATETTLKTLSENGDLAHYRIVHFATHGALTGQVRGSAEPGLILTPPPKGTSDSKGLERDDGFLTASEIATLRLDADWAILSACNTAGASGETAEPLSGMARAFFYAGARALLVSHWEVGSDAAVKLTTRTFAELKSNPRMGRAEAFRLSMCVLIEKGTAGEAHPSQWAPFVVVGEGAAAR